MKIRAKKGKGLKKSVDTEEWLDNVYENNKELIDKRLIPAIKDNLKLKGKTPLELFKSGVNEYLKDKDGKPILDKNGKPRYSPKEALDKYVNKEILLPKKNRLAENALKALRKQTVEISEGKEVNAYKYFRELTKDEKTHRYTKIDLDKFVYEGNGVYIYGAIKISLTDGSPTNVFVGKIEQ